jgi:hypothetical protein
MYIYMSHGPDFSLAVIFRLWSFLVRGGVYVLVIPSMSKSSWWIPRGPESAREGRRGTIINAFNKKDARRIG